MDITTLLLILISIAAAAGLSFYQYYFRARNRTRVQLFLALLRFFAILGILLLLINPKVTLKTFEIEKTPLPVVVDNSASIVDLKAEKATIDAYEAITSNAGLREKFDIQSYRFDNEMELAEEFDFKGRQSNLEQVAKSLKSIHRNKTFPTVLITDGNQTSGNDFVYSFNSNNKVYPVVAGDTTTFLDFRVMQVNANKYAFHKNQFPVEVFLQYSGNKSSTANLSIMQGNSVLQRQTVAFSASKKSVVLKMLLPASSVGLQVYKAILSSPEQEKNKYNNSKNFAVEVIDQKSEVAIVTTINHPDVGALKRSIETNAQRHVTIINPNSINSLDKFNVLIIYQPTAEFKRVFDSNKSAGINTWIITGTNTDYAFLNQQQNNIEFRMSSQKEDYLAGFNSQFNVFALDNIGFESFPPLENAFGTIKTNGNVNVLLNSRIRNIDTGSPMLAFAENEGKRSAYLLGENIWKWRVQSHVDNKSFEKFDIFVDKTIQFLASNASKKSLVVNHESFYNSGDAIEITAQFFNKNYEFDERARLTISVTNKATKASKRYDLLRGDNAFKVNLDGLAAGQYTFSVKELNSNTVYNGYFEILDFDIEKQFVNPDIDKLRQLASQTDAAVFMPNQTEALINALLENDDYKAVQKEVVRKIPLIDSIFLMLFIAACLATEWFTRKYNGMV